MSSLDSISQRPLHDALAQCRGHFAYAAGFSALVNLLYLAPTIFMLQVYDRVLPSRGTTTLGFLVLVLIIALLTLAVLDAVRARLMSRASLRLDRLLSGEALSATLNASTRSRDMLNSQVLREFDVLRQTLTGPVMLALFDAPWTPIFIVVCAIIHPLLGAVVLVGAAVLAGIAFMTERSTRDRLARAGKAANIAYVSQEFTAASGDVIRALGMGRAMVRAHLADRETANRLQTEAGFASGGYLAATRFVRLFLQSLALGVGAFLAIHERISPGAVFAGSLLTSRALAPIEQLLGGWRSVVQAQGAYKALSELLARRSTMRTHTLLPPPQGALQVERLVVLNAARDGAILKEITFAADAGEAIGIVGPSGAGKTTLLRAIGGAVAIDQGSVRFDGADRADWDPDRLGAHLGFMPQDSVLFAGTIKQNIARFDTVLDEAGPELIDARVVAAAQLGEAHETILRLPAGYDTMVGWRGRELSAGQAQGVSLARALYGGPALVLLDEPNAHLDADGELALLRTLQALKARGVTVLVAAHRMSLIGAIDKLLVLRDGRLEAFGPRDEILRRLNSSGRPAETAAVRVVGGGAG